MSEGLRKILNNPFLRESPFRSNQQFYSLPKKYDSQSHYKLPNQKSRYSDLSVSTSNYSSNYGSNMIVYDKKSGGLNKKSNPFHRKYLISSLKPEEYEDKHLALNNFRQTNDQDTIKLDFMKVNEENLQKPLGLLPKQPNCWVSSNIQRSSQNHISKNFPLDISSKEFITINKIYGKQNIVTMGSLMSPRFPSTKILQKPVSLLMQQLISPGSYKNESLGSAKRVQSQKQISKPFIESQDKLKTEYEKQGHVENIKYQQRELNQKQVKILPNDGHPQELIVRGNKFHRSMVELKILK